MKKLVMTIVALSFLRCKAQTEYNLTTTQMEDINTPFYYIKDMDNHHDDVVGVWRWEDGDNSFEMTLVEFEKYNYPSNAIDYRDQIFGKYKYIENNQIITQIDSVRTLPDFNVAANFWSPTEYYIVICDLISETHHKGIFKLISSTTATVELEPIEGIKVNYGNGQPWALPTSMVMTKIE